MSGRDTLPPPRPWSRPETSRSNSVRIPARIVIRFAALLPGENTAGKPGIKVFSSSGCEARGQRDEQGRFNRLRQVSLETSVQGAIRVFGPRQSGQRGGRDGLTTRQLRVMGDGAPRFTLNLPPAEPFEEVIVHMLVHTVYFWLKPELTPAQRSEFRAGVESLSAVKSVDAVYVGTPAATERRPIIDDSYSVALTVLCKDLAAQDAYQVDPVHLAFVANFKTYWSRVQIYDAA